MLRHVLRISAVLSLFVSTGVFADDLQQVPDLGPAVNAAAQLAAEKAAGAFSDVMNGLFDMLATAGGTNTGGSVAARGGCPLVTSADGNQWCYSQGTWFLYRGIDPANGLPVYYYQTDSGWVRAAYR